MSVRGSTGRKRHGRPEGSGWGGLGCGGEGEGGVRAEGGAQGREHAGVSDPTGGADDAFDDDGSFGGPDGGEGECDSGFGGDEGSIGPAFSAVKGGVAADDFSHGLEDAETDGFAVLGHEEDFAGVAGPDLADEFREAGGAGDIEVGVWFEAMAVAAGDGGEAGFGSEAEDLTVFGKTLETVEFESVNQGAVEGEEFVEKGAVGGGGGAFLVVEGVVEDEEGVRHAGEPAEQFTEFAAAWAGGELGERQGDVLGLLGRQVVDSDVEGGWTPGDAPFERDGDIEALAVEVESGVDVVVVGDGNERLEMEGGDLAGFEIVSGAGRDGRPPEAAGEIDAAAGEEGCGASGEEVGGWVAGDDALEEIERLPGVPGVAVEGDGGAEAGGGEAVPGRTEIPEPRSLHETTMAGNVSNGVK